MLEGLEVSEVNYSYVVENNILRLDSNYFLKEFLSDELLISSTKYSKLKNLTSSILSFGAYSLNNEVEYLDKGVPFIRGVNLKNGRINFNNIIYISNDAHKLLWKSEVKPNTVLLSMSGTIGDVAIASKNLKYPLNSNQDIAKIEPKNISSEYLYLFLISKFGQNFLKREARGSVQQHVYLSQIEEFNIPIFNPDFVSDIENLIHSSDEKYEHFQQKYTQAENLLLETLGLHHFQPSVEAINVKSLKESFLNSGRLDAEYYQPKYEDYIRLIKSSSLGYNNLEKVCNLKDKNYSPKDNIEYNYVELSNIGKSGEITGSTIDLGKELPSRARRLVNTGDVIISSIEGSLESCALVTEQYNKAICSTGFYVINSNKINSETLLVLFKSELMQNILKQNCSGTILTAINKNEFLKIPIPYIENSIQTQIAQLLQESFTLKAESEKLLETAKRAVEIAIEESEEAAIIFVNQNN